MNKTETIKFMKKVKTYFPTFSIEDYVVDEYVNKLKPYSLNDLNERFEYYLQNENQNDPPKLHYLIKFLKTEEEKGKEKNDYIIRCNLCGEEMYLKEYDTTHYKKCLLITALLPILKGRGEDVSRETLDEYDIGTLEKVFDKYH